MANRHDEDKVLKSFSRIGRVNSERKTLHVSNCAVVGIKMWGKIDYLTHYRGWTLVSE